MRALRKYQRDAFYYAGAVENPALFLEMRLGKTLITIRRLTADYTNIGPILIVAPFSTHYGWERELKNEGFTDADLLLLYGERNIRLDLLRKPATFNIVNPEAFLFVPEIASVKWQVVICDESTFMKAPPKVNRSNRYDKRASISKFFSDNFKSAKQKYILTGTPNPQSELDFYSQLRFLDEQILPFDNYYKFRHALFTQSQDGKWFLTKRGKDYLSLRLSQFCFFLTRKEVNLGGEKIYETRKVKLTDKTRKIYNTCIDEMIVEIQSDILKVGQHSIQSFTWAREICGGAIRQENLIKQLSGEKIDELVSLIKGELSGQQIVVWANFTHEIENIFQRLQSEKISASFINGSVAQEDRNLRVKRFHSGIYRILICQCDSMQFGADLSCADIAIFFSSPLSLETRAQCEDRIITTEDTSNLIIDLCAEDTIEEDLLDGLKNKEIRIDILRRIIKRLRG